jgi:hypothetical protein
MRRLGVVHSLALALVILALGAGPARADAAKPEAKPVTKSDAPASTYEALAQGATRTRDVATLLGPFIDRCDAEKRDLERARCHASQSYLREILPGRTFSTPADDPATISISDYDAGIKGYHVAFAGCVACTKPVVVGRARERRFITLREPAKDAETLPAAVEISRNAIGFESLVEAKRWLEHVRPFLRAEFLFQPANNE